MLTVPIMTQPPFYIDPTDPPGKQRILTAGLQLFSRHGLEGTSIRDIADRAGLTNPALYKHYKTKDDLALDLFQRCYRRLVADLTRATEGRDFNQGFRAYISVYAQAFDSHPDAAIFANDALPPLWPRVDPAMKTRTAITLLRDLLALGRTQGAIADQDPDLQMTIILGSLSQLIRQLRFQTFPGPAASHVEPMTKMLRAALA